MISERDRMWFGSLWVSHYFLQAQSELVQFCILITSVSLFLALSRSTPHPAITILRSKASTSTIDLQTVTTMEIIKRM